MGFGCVGLLVVLVFGGEYYYGVVDECDDYGVWGKEIFVDLIIECQVGDGVWEDCEDDVVEEVQIGGVFFIEVVEDVDQLFLVK